LRSYQFIEAGFDSVGCVYVLEWHHLRSGVVEDDIESRIEPLFKKGQALMANYLIYEECSMMSISVVDACDYASRRVGM
jgi:hypothetical protein